jgi:hypothetical protein
LQGSAAGQCVRVSRERFLVATIDGQLDGVHVVNCNSPNKCAGCAWRKAVQNVKMLELDGYRGPEPEVWAVLTTPRVTLDMACFYRPLEQTIKALRRRWPVRYCSLLEYTTGYGPRSGGDRRPHLNLLLKDVARKDAGVAGELIRRVWCDQAGASPQAQHVGEVAAIGGLSKYLGWHFHKESQRPPDGFSGQRFNPSKGRWRYWHGDLTAAQMREAAQSALTVEALERKAAVKGLFGATAEAWVAGELDRRAQTNWTIIQFRQDRWGERTVSVLGGEPLAIERGEG